MKALSFLLSAASLAVWASAYEQPPTNAGTGNFHAWTKVNPTPEHISSPLDFMCAGPSPAMVARENSDPHVHKFITVFVNPKGKKAMMKGGKFPVGSIVVKEKHLAVDGPVEMSTVMIKHEKGYNPTCGDWEFATLDSSGAKVTSRGKIEACMKCHVDQKKLDFTFRTYVPGFSPSGMAPWRHRK